MPVAKKSLQKNPNSILSVKISKKPSDDNKKGTVIETEEFKKDGRIIGKNLAGFTDYEHEEPKEDSSARKGNMKVTKIKGAIEYQKGNKKFALSSNPPQSKMQENNKK